MKQASRPCSPSPAPAKLWYASPSRHLLHHYVLIPRKSQHWTAGKKEHFENQKNLSSSLSPGTSRLITQGTYLVFESPNVPVCPRLKGESLDKEVLWVYNLEELVTLVLSRNVISGVKLTLEVWKMEWGSKGRKCKGPNSYWITLYSRDYSKPSWQYS